MLKSIDKKMLKIFKKIRCFKANKIKSEKNKIREKKKEIFLFFKILSLFSLLKLGEARENFVEN